MHRNLWSDTELQVLREYYSQRIPKELCKFLPGRSHHAINAMAEKLGLRKLPEAISRANRESWLGKHHTLETRNKISEAKKGTKTGYRFPKGNVPWNKGKKGLQISLAKGKKYEELFGAVKASQMKEDQARRNIGKKMSPESIEKHNVKMRGDLNPSKRPEVKEKLSKARQELLRNGWGFSSEAIEKIRLARSKQRIPRSKTKPELKFIEMLEKYKAPFKYTGDGSFWVGRLNPDFIHLNHKKLAVEIFGEYWHTPLLNHSVRYEATELGRKERYKKHGWKCIVLWAEPLMAENGEEYALKLLGQGGIKCTPGKSHNSETSQLSSQ